MRAALLLRPSVSLTTLRFNVLLRGWQGRRVVKKRDDDAEKKAGGVFPARLDYWSSCRISRTFSNMISLITWSNGRPLAINSRSWMSVLLSMSATARHSSVVVGLVFSFCCGVSRLPDAAMSFSMSCILRSGIGFVLGPVASQLLTVECETAHCSASQKRSLPMRLSHALISLFVVTCGEYQEKSKFARKIAKIARILHKNCKNCKFYVDKTCKNGKLRATKHKNMINIITQLTDSELTDIGRAMERSGHSDLNSFLKWAVLEKKAEILAKK